MYTTPISKKTIRGKNFKPVELAYLAGLFDGEGCINIYRIQTIKGFEKRKYPRFELSATLYNTHKATIDYFHNLVGGYCKTYNRHNIKWKLGYGVKLSSNQALVFIELIQPYLKIKAKQAEIAIEFQTRKLNKKNRFRPWTEEEFKFYDKCWKRMSMLNSRGRRSSPAETKRKDGSILEPML